MDEEQKKQAMAAAHKAARDFWDGALEDSVRVAVEAFTKFGDTFPNPDPKPDPDPKPTTDFRVFEDINYRGRPNLQTKFGMEPIQIHYESAFFDNRRRAGDGDFTLPKTSRIIAAARSAAPVSIIDIERYWSKSDNDLDDKSAPACEHVAEIYDENLDREKLFGFYSTIPIRSLNKIRQPSWERTNDRLKGLGQIVDMTFPSLYSLVDEDNRWEEYAIANIAEAKRIAPGKPCYPFLWPQYHSNAKQKKGQPVPGDIWRRQLDLCREFAEGVVIWTRSDTKQIDFSDIPEWWDETVDFLDSLQ